MKSRLSSCTPYVCSACRRRISTASRNRLLSTRAAPADIYDIVAVGGGPVGLALLVALSMKVPRMPAEISDLSQELLPPHRT